VLQQVQDIARQNQRDPDSITLVAVTKGHNPDEIQPLYDLGCRHFAENRVDAALEKMEKLPKDIQWHFIGSLQKNKVRKVIGKFALIHSVDTPELAKKISDCSLEAGLKTPILLQANTSGEESKHGLTFEEWQKKYPELVKYEGIVIKGLMTMAPLIDDEKIIRDCFAKLRHLGENLKLQQLSMGMSHDYPLAIAEGATLLRIGSALF
jgi:pyridoxal phosphate enzyme (YggS family)